LKFCCLSDESQNRSNVRRLRRRQVYVWSSCVQLASAVPFAPQTRFEDDDHSWLPTPSAVAEITFTFFWWSRSIDAGSSNRVWCNKSVGEPGEFPARHVSAGAVFTSPYTRVSGSVESLGMEWENEGEWAWMREGVMEGEREEKEGRQDKKTRCVYVLFFA